MQRDAMDGRFSKILAAIIVIVMAAILMIVTYRSFAPGKLEQMATEGEAVTADDFAVEEYIYEDDNLNKRYLLLVTNNSAHTIDFDCNTTGFDAEGKSIGISYNRINSIEPGNTGCMEFSFSSGDVEKFEYELYYELAARESAMQNIRTEEKRRGTSMVVTVKNISERPVSYMRADAVFFQEGKVVSYSFDYIHDEDSEDIASASGGKTIFECDEDFDEVKVFYSCQMAR